MLKKIYFIFIFVFAINNAFAQVGTEEEFALQDSLVNLVENLQTESYYFEVEYKENDKKPISISYYVQVSNNSIVSISRTYRIETLQNWDEKQIMVVTIYKEHVSFYQNKLLQVDHKENPMFYDYVDGKNENGNEGTQWEVHYMFIGSKMINYFSNGHGLSESDEWNAEEYAKDIVKEMKAAVKKKYPKFK